MTVLEELVRMEEDLRKELSVLDKIASTSNDRYKRGIANVRIEKAVKEHAAIRHAVNELLT